MTPAGESQPAVVPATSAGERGKAAALAHWPLSLAVFTCGLLLDIWSKVLAQTHLAARLDRPFGQPIMLIPNFFELRYAENDGAAFSMLAGRPGFLALVSLVTVSGLLWWWSRLPSREVVGRVALSLVVSGAIGNFLDRFLRGYVVDFFHAFVIWKGQMYSYPVFNVADSFICIGIGILILQTYRGKL